MGLNRRESVTIRSAPVQTENRSFGPMTIALFSLVSPVQLHGSG